jgi:hypothetical protein
LPQLPGGSVVEVDDVLVELLVVVVLVVGIVVVGAAIVVVVVGGAMVVVVVDGATPETLSWKEPVPPPKPSTKM